MKSIRTKLLFYGLNRYQAKLSVMDVAQARIYFDRICKSRYKPPVATVSEVLIGPNRTLKLRTYESSESDVPTIVYFHGGGFAVGSIDSHDTVARLLCRKTGCNVVSVDYRLAPEHPYPAAVDDGETTLEWLQNQQQLDSRRVFLAGDSAGGHIALYTLLRSRQQQAMIKGLVLFYPALDPGLKHDSMARYGRKHFLTKADMEQFWAVYLTKHETVWPLTKTQLTNLPPILIQAAEYDILKDEALQLAKDVKAVGGSCKYREYPQTSHGFMQIPSPISRRNRALSDVAHFIQNI